MDRYEITQGKKPPPDKRSQADKDLEEFYKVRNGTFDANLSEIESSLPSILFGYNQEERDLLDRTFGRMSDNRVDQPIIYQEEIDVVKTQEENKEEPNNKPQDLRYKFIKEKKSGKNNAPIKKKKSVLRKINLIDQELINEEK